MSDRDAFRPARDAAKAKLHEKRLEAATYTAAEVKVLTETASKVAYELGRKDTGEQIASMIKAHRDADDSTREFRLGLSVGAKIAQDLVRQPSGAAPDAISGVPGHSEVPEAPKAPQEPCGRPECYGALMHTHPAKEDG